RGQRVPPGPKQPSMARPTASPRSNMIIVGLSPIVHESAASILVDGKLVAAASEERFSRVKNQGGFPHQALRYCLARAGVTASDVDHVAYAALPFGKERLRDL